MSRSIPSFYVVAGLIVGAACGYGAATIQAVADLKVMNQWDLAYAYNYEGFSAAYVATCLFAGFAAFATMTWRRRTAQSAPPESSDGLDRLDGLDELIGQARANAETGQQPVNV